MKTPRTAIAGIIARRALNGRMDKAAVRGLAAYLLEENRTGELDSIMRDVQADWANSGVVEVIASSAHALSPQALRDIETEVRRVYPTVKRIIITPRIDSSLIGGVQLTFVDYRLDMSIAGELRKFKVLAANERTK